MERYEDLFNKVIAGVESCNEADGYSECSYCIYHDECAKNGDLYPGLAMGKALERDIERLSNIMHKLDEMGGMK